MVNLITKVLVRHQAKQEQQRRLEENRKQLKLIYNGLIERG